MSFQPVLDGGSVTVTLETWDNQIVQNVFGFVLSGTFTQSAADDISDVMAAAYTHTMPYVFSENQINSVVVTDLRTEGAAQFTSTSSWPIAGGSGADPLPGFNAALITWRTALRGSNNRGRTFFGGLTEAAVTSGLVTSALLGGMELFGQELVDNGAFTVISRYHNKLKRAEATSHIITGYTARDQFCTQRRRSILG